MSEEPRDDSQTAFNADQFANPYPDGIQHHYWTLARNAMIVRALHRQKVEEPVIDVGCGRGITVEYLRRHDVDAIGADTGTPQPIVPEVSAFLHLGQDALQLPEDLRRRARSMLLLDVLEHVPEPAVFVAALADAFPNCRDIIVTVPARQELWSNYDEYYGHFRRYDLGSARLLFPPELFEPTEARYAFRLLYPPARLLARLKRNRAVSIAAPSPVLQPLHRMLAGYFRIESMLLPCVVPGSSLLLSLRRK